MKKRILLLVLLGILAITGAVWAQTDEVDSFALLTQIGRTPPDGIHYDPNFDRFAWVDRRGRLVLVDAATFQVQHVLHNSGTFSGYQFSHNGRWLALAIDRRVELWDAQTGGLVQTFEPPSALSIRSLLQFSDDDTLLMLTAVVPAPSDIRRSETDTSQTPWLWELAAERGERRSILPLQRIQQPFFDLRNGLLLTPDNRLLAAYSGLMQLMDITADSYPVLTNIPANRYERDPFDTWYGMDGDHLYYRQGGSRMIQQIRTDNAAVIDISTGAEQTARTLDQFNGLSLSDYARIIGEPNTLRSNSLLTLLLGPDYHGQFNHHPLTVTLIDVLQPVTVTPDQQGLLIYILDETTGRGAFELVRPLDIVSMTLHPDRRHLAVRRLSGVQPLEVYDMVTGDLVLSIVPVVPDPSGTQVLDYNAAGDVLISGFQRFDSRTGALLHEDLSYQWVGFDQWFFTDDSRRLVTLTGPRWQLWDLDTQQVIRRETVQLRGELLDVTDNAQRFLTRYNEGLTYEVVEVGTEERFSVTFDRLPERFVEQVLYSSDWQNYLVIYSANSYYQHAPGNEIALYNLREGLRWFIAGADLPSLSGRSYGWLDNQTIYLTAQSDGWSAPERIYGLEYDESGLPQCLLDAFPETWTQWRDLWERLVYYSAPDSLGRLTQRLCGALPGAADDVNAVFFPSPTPTRPVVTATPAMVAGVPACLTRRFPNDARDYADDWRAMIDGLPPEQVAEIERLLCEGLGDASSIGTIQRPQTYTSTERVMLIDAVTGSRRMESALPPRPHSDRQLARVYEEFRISEGFVIDYGVLSPDNQLLAVRTGFGNIAVYRLTRPYDSLMAELTATAAVGLTNAPNAVALAPTATLPAVDLGAPRATLTPTATLLPPPTPQATVTQESLGQVDTMCPSTTIYQAWTNPPPDFAPTGRLLASRAGDSGLWVYPLDDTGGYRDVTLSVRGQLSPDQRYQVIWEERIVVANADGTNPVVLFEAVEQSVFPYEIIWLDDHTLQYSYSGYLPDRYASEVSLVRRYDVRTGQLSDPELPRAGVTINTLPASIVSTQPRGGPWVVAQVSYNAGLYEGLRYYLVNRDTNDIVYLAQNPDPRPISALFEWHPSGQQLYYTPPLSTNWLVFDVATGEQRILGELPGGEWSRDLRWRIRPYTPPPDEIEARREAGQPIPNLALWDSQSGLTRRYCVPNVGTLDGVTLLGSPDSRYLAFTVVLLSDAGRDVVRPRTLLLDLETGSVTEWTFEIDQLVLWSE